MLEKDQAQAKMLSGFNKYREKKSAQMRKCEQEIVTLFNYAEKLEVIVKMAEEGKFYTQQSQHNDGYGGTDAGRGATMLIPASLKPSRPGSDKTKTPQLALSQRIVKKSKEHAAQDEQIKKDAIEALLVKHGGYNSAQGRDEFVETPEITNQIRSLLSSPSVGRDLVAVPHPTGPPGSSRQKEDTRDKLFSRETLGGGGGSGGGGGGGGGGGANRRHTISSPTAKDKNPIPPPRTGSATVRAHHSSAAGPGPRAANSIRKKSVSIQDSNEKGEEQAQAQGHAGTSTSFQPSADTLESSLFCNPENIKYVFNDEGSNQTGGVGMPSSNFDTMMVLPPAQTEPLSIVKAAQELEAFRSEVKKKGKDIERLEMEVQSLRDELAANEQVDINQILQSVEGNETLEYIRQLENEQLALRSSVKEVSNQLQTSKVANAALTRQFQSYKTQMKKRPASGKVITVQSS